MAMARSRGAVSGPLLMLLGAWGAVIPFVGHYFGYGYTPDNTWGWTAARGWMEVLPGGCTFLGGLIMTTSRHRAAASFGGWLAALSGAWFALGLTVMPWWNSGFIGVPMGDTNHVVFEHLGMFTGLGVLIVLLAAFGMGRFSVIGVRDVAVAQRRLDAYRTIEDAPAYPDETATTTGTTDVAAAEARAARNRELHETSH
jgi:hypothetical protein